MQEVAPRSQTAGDPGSPGGQWAKSSNSALNNPWPACHKRVTKLRRFGEELVKYRADIHELTPLDVLLADLELQLLCQEITETCEREQRLETMPIGIKSSLWGVSTGCGQGAKMAGTFPPFEIPAFCIRS